MVSGRCSWLPLVLAGAACSLDTAGQSAATASAAGSTGSGGEAGAAGASSSSTGGSSGSGGEPTAQTCNDGLANGDETDVDCGGSCAACAFGQACAVDGDCGVQCLRGKCAPDPVRIWEVAAPAASPSSRYLAAMSSTSDGVVLFGGLSLVTSMPVGDLWDWLGTSWLLSTAAGPSPRYAMPLVYDSKRAMLVLFSGASALGGDTWELDPATDTWVQSPAMGPPTQYYHSMAYDAARGKVVLFGGTSGDLITWEYDGTTWIATGVMGPAHRYSAMMAYDEARKVVVLFGGFVAASGTHLGDTWTLDAAGWQQLSPAVAPPARATGAMVYDPTVERVVLLGGATDKGVFSDCWELDGTTWIPSAGTPLSVNWTVAAFDPVRRRIVVHAEATGTAFPGATWESFNVAVPCTVATDCGSGHCVDGLCCLSACTGGDVCNTPGSPGFCAAPRTD